MLLYPYVVGTCNCLCTINHKEQRGICTGTAVLEVPFGDPNLESTTWVAMCQECKDAFYTDAATRLLRDVDNPEKR